MHKKLRHITTIIGLLLCITLSVAWMTELDSQEGRFLYLRYDNKLYSAANELDAQLLLVETKVENGATQEVLTDITNRYDDDPTAPLLSTENFAPGDYKAFALRLQNKTNASMSVAINLAKIEGDALFYDYMNVGISNATGFTEDCPAPMIEEFAVADRINSGAVILDNMLLLPPTEDPELKDNVVEIRFYVRFSHEATNELQNKTFKIGVINVIAA